MITQENLKTLLESLGFTKDSKKLIYTKHFENVNTSLSVDFTNKKLMYPKEIIRHDETTSNFSHPENFVVFECVHRLLEKGYKPSSLELEPRWNLGRDKKGGKADILVRDLSLSYENNHKGNPYLIIECKTSSKTNEKSEFAKEWDKMQENGGQLFSYFQQERSVKYLCLYTSDFINSTLNYENYIITMQDNEEYLKEHKKQSYENAPDVKSIFRIWSDTYAKEYKTNGIFEEEIKSYTITNIKPKLEHLKSIDSNDIHKKKTSMGDYTKSKHHRR